MPNIQYAYRYQTEGKEAAKKALQRLQSNDDVVEVYLELIQEEIQAMDASAGTFSTWDLFCSQKRSEVYDIWSIGSTSHQSKLNYCSFCVNLVSTGDS